MKTMKKLLAALIIILICVNMLHLTAFAADEELDEIENNEPIENENVEEPIEDLNEDEDIPIEEKLITNEHDFNERGLCTICGAVYNFEGLYNAITPCSIDPTLPEISIDTVILLNDITNCPRTRMIYRDITIDLNGHTLTLDAAADDVPIIRVASGRTLTIIDSSPEQTGTICGKGNCVILVEADAKLILNSGIISNGSNSGVMILPNGYFEMNGGTITANNATCIYDYNDKLGGGVTVFTDATFIMNNGTISNNSYNHAAVEGVQLAVGGGGVGVYGGTFILNNGSIINNTSTHCGGGIFLRDNATFVMNGGSVSYNSIDNDDFWGSGHGGGIGSHAEVNFTMNGGIVSYNTNKCNVDEYRVSVHGAGIAIEANGTYPNVKFTGGTIKNNICYNGWGGGIFYDGSAGFDITGMTIIDNENHFFGGGGVAILSEATITIGRGTYIANNVADGSELSGAYMRDFDAEYRGGGGIVQGGKGTTIIDGAEVLNNYAIYGGGISCGSDGYRVCPDETNGSAIAGNGIGCIEFKSGKLYNNSASAAGDDAFASATGSIKLTPISIETGWELNGYHSVATEEGCRHPITGWFIDDEDELRWLCEGRGRKSQEVDVSNAESNVAIKAAHPCVEWTFIATYSFEKDSVIYPEEELTQTKKDTVYQSGNIVIVNPDTCKQPIGSNNIYRCVKGWIEIRDSEHNFIESIELNDWFADISVDGDEASEYIIYLEYLRDATEDDIIPEEPNEEVPDGPEEEEPSEEEPDIPEEIPNKPEDNPPIIQTPVKDEPEEEIPEEDIPLVDEPEEEIPNDDVPLIDLPEVEEEIPEDDVPLSDLPPSTGDNSLLFAAIALLSTIGLICIIPKKHRSNK